MALPRTFDFIFEKYRGRLPVNFLRSLAKRESNLNPNESKDPAWGLMQVVPSVRTSYNERFKTSYTKQDLLDPAINVRIASELLNRIVAQYARFHPNTPNMREDWSNPEFVSLVVAGWNSGYSEAAGVGRVAKYLESKSIPVTHDNVFKYAAQAGGTQHLQNDAKRVWQKSVVQLYFAEGGPGLGGSVMMIALAGFFGWLIYRLWR